MAPKIRTEVIAGVGFSAAVRRRADPRRRLEVR